MKNYIISLLMLFAVVSVSLASTNDIENVGLDPTTEVADYSYSDNVAILSDQVLTLRVKYY